MRCGRRLVASLCGLHGLARRSLRPSRGAFPRNTFAHPQPRPLQVVGREEARLGGTAPCARPCRRSMPPTAASIWQVPRRAGWQTFCLLSALRGTLYQKRYCGGIDWRTGILIQYIGAGLLFALGAFAFETREIRWSGELIFALAWLVLVFCRLRRSGCCTGSFAARRRPVLPVCFI